MEQIAIVGVSCLFPGAHTPEQFWENLMAGKDCTALATAEDLGADPEAFFDSEKGRVDKIYNLQGGFVRDFEFDPTGYALDADTLSPLDDLFKWSLYAGREALKDGGYWQDNLTRCGLVLGNLSLPTRQSRRFYNQIYQKAMNPILCELLGDVSFELPVLSDAPNTPHNTRISGHPATVTAEALSLGGMSLALDAACASSLYAVDLACRYLRSHDVDMMLAGAVSCADPLFVRHGFSIFQAYPSNGQSRPLDRATSGLVDGQGAGMFVLKRLDDAQRDGDQIYGVIRGIGLSNDGSGKSVLNPNKKGQIRAFESAYEQAQIDPGEVGYVECHATGTPVGDPVELDSMADFWQGRPLPHIGSVKSNMGHLLTASGMASMLKVLLSFKQGQIPRTIHTENPSMSTCGDFGPDHIVTEPISWSDCGDRFFAGVNAFGFGGTNAHLILEQEPIPPAPFPKRKGGEKQEGVLEFRGQKTLGIVGMAATFGGCEDLRSFAQMIYNGESHMALLPPNRWAGLEERSSVMQAMNLACVPEGGYIENLDIDFLSLKTPPSENDQLIPQQLLMMQVADEAIKDAHLSCGGRVGVIIAMDTELDMHKFLVRSDLSWQIRLGLEKAGVILTNSQVAELERLVQESVYDLGSANQFTSFIGNIMAGRISAMWDFSGPAFTVSAEELGVPRALEIAQMMLESEDVEAVVVGAVDLAGSFESTFAHCQILPDMEIIGEGAGAVVLKRVDQINADAHVYAVVDGLVVGQVDHHLPKTDYLEICTSSQNRRDEITRICREQDLTCGSVKDHIGHAFHAGSMASLIKAGVCLSHRFWPGEQLANGPNGTAGVYIAGTNDLATCLLLSASATTAQANGRSLLEDQVEENHRKKLVKTVTLGRTPIWDALHVQKNKPRFATRVLEGTPSLEAHLSSSENGSQSFVASWGGGDHSVFIAERAQAVQEMANRIQRDFLPTLKEEIVWDLRDLETFAEGNIADVFGPEYGIIDSYARRVRLPMHPYLLVSRVTKVDGQRGVFQPSTMTTEYDIPHNAWYSIDGSLPWAVVVESGQCDLLLISYLGIDFESKGERIYRLLDCTLTFLDQMPKEGDTLRYDIKINSFSRSGDSLLFFFSYECFVKDKMILKMDGGCAGFFTDQELAQGKGVIFSEAEMAKKASVTKRVFDAPLVCDKRVFDRDDLVHLTKGDLAACFGNPYEPKGENPSLRLPPEAMLMIDRVISVHPKGGIYGLGEVIAEKDLAPDHWYFPCHFKDDQVLAGSLMGEACAQMLQFFALYLGLQTQTMDARFEPMVNVRQKVRCRGQVIPSDRLLVYRLEVKKIELAPVPSLVADVEVWLKDKMVVYFENLSLQLIDKVPAQTQRHEIVARSQFDLADIREFAMGSVAKCFGEAYSVFDTRRCPRTPNGDLQLISRVNLIGKSGGPADSLSLVSEYDVPQEPWFYAENPGEYLPYSVLMEIALQPSGFLTAYHGSTLAYPDVDFYYRNLDGSGHLIKDVDVRGKIIENRMRFLSSTALDGVIIQKFAFELFCEDECFYVGDATFGFFSAQALSRQVGLDNGKVILPWFESQGRAGKDVNLAQLQDMARGKLRLASGPLHFIDHAHVVADGGKYGKGYVYASKQIDPEDWFYACHFYQDPVMPGSLGIEAILQAMQVYAMEQGLGDSFCSPQFALCPEQKTVWKYRGQILQTNKQMSLEVHIKEIVRDDGRCTLIADASLWKETMRIYDVHDLALNLVDKI